MAQKYALVVGCNYSDTGSALMGCINDANSMYDVLANRFFFRKNNIVLLTDNPDSQNMPTASHIKDILIELFSIANYGDVVFLFFAGHGTIVPANKSSTHRDEQAIVASDFNLITSIDFRQILNRAPDGVQFIIMSDSCHSGGLIDKEQEQIGPHHPPRYRGFTDVERPRMIPFEVVMQQLSLQNQFHTLPNVRSHFGLMSGFEASLVFQRIPPQPRLQVDQGILLSACQPDELAGERMFDGITHGVFTSAVLYVLRMRRIPISNGELVLQARRLLEEENFETQHPCLYSSDRNAYAFFL